MRSPHPPCFKEVLRTWRSVMQGFGPVLGSNPTEKKNVHDK